ncbi:MAG: lytic murein transglycosylase [Azospirillum sp.]|nr:lytic murein transglycosylase [Azospirillum sp.]
MDKRWLGVAAVLGLVSACAGDGVSASGGSQSVAATGATAGDTRVAALVPFPQWRDALRAEALRRGVSGRTFDLAFAGIQLSDRVLELDGSQPEFTRAVWSYLDSAVSENRVREGRAKLQANAALLSRVEREFKVPPQILIGFWGIESDYGRDVGKFKVIDALATLAYKSRRTGFFRSELLLALQILEKGDIAPERMRGSWAGAMGQTQFIPSIFVQHALDYDGDGRRDIWDSLPDVFASTAHFVAGIGWRAGESWGEEVRLPPSFPWDQAELTVTKPLEEWRRLGVRRLDGALPSGTDTASVLIPGGHSGPAFLVRENFRVIMRYNPSISYALAVALLADRIAGGGPIAAAWPRAEQPLSRSEAIELQQRLTALGFDTGKPDGLVGPATRTALRGFQKAVGLVPDGFATKSLLDRLRTTG